MKPVAPVIRTFIRCPLQSRVMPRNGPALAEIMRYISGARSGGDQVGDQGLQAELPARHQVQRRLHPRPRPAGDEVRRQLALLQQRHVRPHRPRREAAIDDLALGARQQGRVLPLRLLTLHGVQDRRDVLAPRRVADRLDHLPAMAVHDRVRAVGGGQLQPLGAVADQDHAGAAGAGGLRRALPDQAVPVHHHRVARLDAGATGRVVADLRHHQPRGIDVADSAGQGEELGGKRVPDGGVRAGPRCQGAGPVAAGRHHPVPDRPAADARPQRLDGAGPLVAGHAGVAGGVPGEAVVQDPALGPGADGGEAGTDPHLPGPGIAHLDPLECRLAHVGEDRCLGLCHASSSLPGAGPERDWSPVPVSGRHGT